MFQEARDYVKITSLDTDASVSSEISLFPCISYKYMHLFINYLKYKKMHIGDDYI